MNAVLCHLLVRGALLGEQLRPAHDNADIVVQIVGQSAPNLIPNLFPFRHIIDVRIGPRRTAIRRSKATVRQEQRVIFPLFTAISVFVQRCAVVLERLFPDLGRTIR